MKASNQLLHTVIAIVAGLFLMLSSPPANAAYTSYERIDRVLVTSGGPILVELDGAAAIAPPFSCPNWNTAAAGTHRGYLVVNATGANADTVRAQLAVAMLAMGSGKKAAYSASSCYGNSGYPLIDHVLIYYQ